MFKDNGRVISKKNYVYLGLIIIFSLMIVYYVYLWHQSYKESLLSSSVIDDYLNVIQFNEIDDYVMENKDVVLYVSVLGNEKINDFEMRFINTICDYSLRDFILYMDVSDLDKSDVFEKFGNGLEYPYIVIYTNGNITDVYSISKDNYSTKKIVSYLNRIGVLSDD